MVFDRVTYRPNPENRSWLEKRPSLNKNNLIDTLIREHRLKNGDNSHTEEEMELLEVEEAFEEQVEIIRKANRKIRLLEIQKTQLSSYILALRHAEDDRKVEQILNAKKEA